MPKIHAFSLNLLMHYKGIYIYEQTEHIFNYFISRTFC